MAVDAMTAVLTYRNDLQSIQRAGQQAQRAVQRSLQSAGQIRTNIDARIDRATISRLQRQLQAGLGNISIRPTINRADIQRFMRQLSGNVTIMPTVDRARFQNALRRLDGNVSLVPTIDRVQFQSVLRRLGGNVAIMPTVNRGQFQTALRQLGGNVLVTPTFERARFQSMLRQLGGNIPVTPTVDRARLQATLRQLGGNILVTPTFDRVRFQSSLRQLGGNIPVTPTFDRVRFQSMLRQLGGNISVVPTIDRMRFQNVLRRLGGNIEVTPTVDRARFQRAIRQFGGNISVVPRIDRVRFERAIRQLSGTISVMPTVDRAQFQRSIRQLSGNIEVMPTIDRASLQRSLRRLEVDVNGQISMQSVTRIRQQLQSRIGNINITPTVDRSQIQQSLQRFFLQVTPQITRAEITRLRQVVQMGIGNVRLSPTINRANLQRSIQQLNVRVNARISQTNIARLRRQIREGIGTVNLAPTINRTAVQRARRQIQAELDKIRLRPQGGLPTGGAPGTEGGGFGAFLGRGAGIAAGVGITAGTLAGIGRATVDLARLGDRLDVVQMGFENLATNAGISAREFQSTISNATQGLLSNADEIELGRDILATGIQGLTKDTEQFITDVADVAVLRGRDIQESLARVVSGIQKQETELLDELGVKVLVDTANRRYAESIGVAAKELTDAQKIEAFYTETLRQLNIQAERSGRLFSGRSEQFRNTTTEVANLRREWSDFLAVLSTEAQPIGTATIGILRNFLADTRQLLESFSSTFRAASIRSDVERASRSELEEIAGFRLSTRTTDSRTGRELFLRETRQQREIIGGILDRQITSQRAYNQAITDAQNYLGWLRENDKQIQANKRSLEELAKVTATPATSATETQRRFSSDLSLAQRRSLLTPREQLQSLALEQLRLAIVIDPNNEQNLRKYQQTLQELDKAVIDATPSMRDLRQGIEELFDTDFDAIRRNLESRVGRGFNLEEEFIPLTAPLPADTARNAMDTRLEISQLDITIQSLGETVAEAAGDLAVGEASFKNFIREVVSTVAEAAISGAREQGGGLIGAITDFIGGTVTNVAVQNNPTIQINPSDALRARNAEQRAFDPNSA